MLLRVTTVPVKACIEVLQEVLSFHCMLCMLCMREEQMWESPLQASQPSHVC